MSGTSDPGEPVSGGRRDRRAAEDRARRNALFLAMLFGGVFLVNGILLVLIAILLEALGLRGASGVP